MTDSGAIEKIINGPPKLSDDQKKAVLSKSRYNRIIAGAGAGKTETLTRRIAYLLLVENVEPASIVAFTFTEKAAQSMKSRVYRRIGEIAGDSATANLGEMYVGTIHAYAKRILEDFFKFGNHTVLDDNEEIAFLMRHGWELGFAKLGGSYSDRCRSFLRSVNMVWDEMLDENELEKRAPDFYKRLKQYEEKLKEHRLLTFGRMIYDAVLKLREHPDRLRTVKHLIVDEYQDINQAQSELINCVGRNASIFVVGDPRQSIYQWRGSDERFFAKFSTTFPDTYEVTIRENRRSVKRIVKNANRFSASFERRRYEEMDPTREEEGFIGIASHETPKAEAVWIVDQIQVLMKRNKELKFSDFGILTRSVSTSAEPLIAELKARRIPYIVGGKVGLFKRDEAQALGRIFAWFSERGFWREDLWKRDQSTIGEDLLISALAHWNNAHGHGYPAKAEEKLREIKLNLNSASSTYNNFTKIYYDVLNALGFKQLNFKNESDAAVMANLGRFNNLLTDYETANRIGGRTPNWASELYGLCWFMNTYALTSYEEQPSDDIRGIEAVQVMTVHQAKGLEWPTVFLFATVVRRFPASLVGRPQDWCDIPRDLFDVKRYEGDIEDERRLFYVAITRARDALIVSHFRKLTRSVSRSEFIDHMDTGAAVNLTDNDQVPGLKIDTGQMADEIQTFSAGEIITYNVCPHMYLLRDLWGYQPQLNPAIGYGNGLHYCLKIAGEMIRDQKHDPISAVTAVVEEDFHMPFVGGKVLETFRTSAKNRLVNFARKYGDDLRRVEEVEYRLEYPIQNATIMGKVDVIMKNAGEMEVRDYKTSEEVRTFEEICVQVRLYSAGLKSMGRPITSGSVAYLDEPTIKMVDVSDPLLNSERKKAEEIVAKIVNKKFEPQPGQNCSRCDQESICRWHNT